MCALLGEKTHISRNKITENEQKDVKRTQNYRKKKQNHQKTTENNEYRENNALFVVFWAELRVCGKYTRVHSI